MSSMLSLRLSFIKQSYRFTYREEHTLALPHDSTTAEESDEEQYRPEHYQQVSHVQQLSHLLRCIINFFY